MGVGKFVLFLIHSFSSSSFLLFKGAAMILVGCKDKMKVLFK